MRIGFIYKVSLYGCDKQNSLWINIIKIEICKMESNYECKGIFNLE